MFLFSLYEGVFSLAHILYLVANAIWFSVGIILIKKYVKNESTLKWIIRISGIILLITICIKQTAELFFYINLGKDLHWYNIFPKSFCSFTSFVLAFAAIYGKRNNMVFHFAVFFAFYGGFLSILYPDFLAVEPIYSLSGFTSLFHHSLQCWIVLVILFTKYITPSYKKIINLIVGYAVMLWVGVIELYLLKYDTAMNINKPLLSDLPIITSWYFLYIASIGVTLLFIFILKKIYKQKDEN